MAHSPSAKKRHRQSLGRQVRNRARITETRSAVRRAREAIVAGNADEAQTAVRAAGAILDRAARKGVVHANNASRRKSRLMRQLNAIGTAGAAEAPKRRGRAPAKKTSSRPKKA